MSASIPNRHRAIALAALVTFTLLGSACVAPAGGEPPRSKAPRTTTTTTTLPPATMTDLMDPYAPGLGNGGYDALHYHVDMAFTLNAPENVEEGAEYDPADAEVRVDATTTIDIAATQPLTEIAFDFTGSTVTSVTVDGAEASFEREPVKLLVTLPEPAATGDEISIAVAYTGKPDMIDSRVARVEVGWAGTPEGSWHVRTDPDGAHRWFPVNDHPSDKATYLFDILVPIEYAAGAPGVLERSYSGIESSSYRWAVNDEIPPSGTTAVIGALEVVPDERASAGLAIDIRHLLPADMAADRPGALDNIPDMMGFFEERFGPFPYDAFGVAVVDGPITGLGANSWAILSRAELEDEDAELAIVRGLVRHWFGDSLTPASWKDVWLSASLVRYAEWLWIERDLGDRYADAVASKARSNVAQSGWPPPTEPRIGDAYVGSVFIHGAIALHAVRLRMGDAAFFDMISTFYDEFAGGTATTNDLNTVVLREAGSTIRYVYDQWLTADELPGFPDR
ncbi:MAG: M1 family aminopeptidase [Acidimicrobiia bacterium]|nr:M1 family aminopeptidase [Acidimicrobiia bacterium]